MVRADVGASNFPIGPLRVIIADQRMSTRDNMKIERKPRPKEIGTLVGVRLQPDLLAFIDTLRQRHDPALSRPEAVRQSLDALRMAESRRGKGHLPAGVAEGAR